MRNMMVMLLVIVVWGCSDTSTLNSGPTYKITRKNVYFGLYTNGSMPAGSIDIENTSRRKASFEVEFLFLDQNNRIVSESYEYVMDLPPGMRKEVSVRSTNYFRYPEEGWSYIINVNKKEAERGPLPVKYE